MSISGIDPKEIEIEQRQKEEQILEDAYFHLESSHEALKKFLDDMYFNHEDLVDSYLKENIRLILNI